MDQFNRNTYKKKTMFQEFYGTCLGKIIVLGGIFLILFILAVISVPNEQTMRLATEDNIRQCLQENDSLRGDGIDEFVSNISRTFTDADTTYNDKEMMDAYRVYNALEIREYSCFSKALIVNNTHPQSVCVGWGFFGMVISTVNFEDLVLYSVPVRGDYNKKLIPEPLTNDDDLGENPHLQPYHYKGNPDN